MKTIATIFSSALAAIFCLGFITVSAHSNTFTTSDAHAFLKSFVTHYEFNPEGRYTHEYHPFLLQWTSESLKTLERRLVEEKLNLSGRMIIMGYEEQAVPQYYTNFKRSKINDEATRKTHTGWSLRLHNRFGFMTGFLFKDLPYITKHYLPAGESVYEHIDADLIPIFNDHAFIFHEHAFGQALPLIRDEQKVLHHKLVYGNDKDVLIELESFWQTLYRRSLKVGNQQIAGTQDVLFSVAYATHLAQSPLPLIKFFIGPDITYPIEVTVKHDKLATLHAQNFISSFTQKLKPIDGQNTVYVFCSFVDGVGKSTMLGNMKNWMQFGTDVEKFGHVDNSSSQLCELFQCRDKIFIADLPAQVSHFSYKPDGLVFVDARTHYAKEKINQIERWVLANKQSLQKKAQELFAAVNDIILHKGYDAAELHDSSNPLFAFAKNVLLLNKDQDAWVPFVYEGECYLFKETRPLEIRYLTSLGTVKSEGLKNIESEQMLFFEGIRFPLPYTAFLDDLIAQFKKQDIQNVVFVDFLSMYPRSSRENVRINYLLQQMAILNNQFKPQVSLYKDFVSGGELLHTLLCKNSVLQIRASFELEALLRLALFKILITRQQGDVSGVSLPELTQSLKQESAALSGTCDSFAAQLVHRKMLDEAHELEKLYGLSKSFVNIQRFSFNKIQAMSDALQEFFTQHFDHEVIKQLWRPVEGLVNPPQIRSEAERSSALVMTEEGDTVKLSHIFNRACKNETFLAPFLRSIRACWYASILNIFSSSIKNMETFSLQKEQYKGVPIMLFKGDNNLFYAFEHNYEVWQKSLSNTARSDFRYFNLATFRPTSYVTVADEQYRADWDSKATGEGLFGFDCKLNKDASGQQSFGFSTVSKIVQKYQNLAGSTIVMPTTDLWQALEDDKHWRFDSKDRLKTAMNNGTYQKPGSRQESGSSWGTRRIMLGAHEHIPLAQMVVRLLATLEMFVKDADADVVVRDGDRDDFKAALKLFEHVVLPRYCNIIFAEDLFDDYDDVEPYPSWDFWEELEG